MSGARLVELPRENLEKAMGVIVEKKVKWWHHQANGRVAGGRGALPAITGNMSARKREKSAMFAPFTGQRVIEIRIYFELTVTISRRKTGESLSESFKMRTLGDFVGEWIPHAFCRCCSEICVEVTVVGRHCFVMYACAV